MGARRMDLVDLGQSRKELHSHKAAVIYECDFGISGLPKYNLFQDVISNKRIDLFFL